MNDLLLYWDWAVLSEAASLTLARQIQLYGDLCLFRRHDALEAQIVFILAPTGESAGGRTPQPGGKLRSK